MSIARTILSFIVGFVVIQVVVMVTNGIGGVVFNSMPDPQTKLVPEDADSSGLCLWNILWYLPACAAGAFVAAKIARARPWRPVYILLFFVVVGGTVYAVLMPPFYREMGADIPGWCLPVLPVTGAMGLLLGAWLAGACRKTAGAGAASADTSGPADD